MDKKTECYEKQWKIKGSAKKWKKDRRSAKKLPNLEYISSESPSSDESNEPLCNLKIFCVTLTKNSKSKIWNLGHVIGTAAVAAAISLDEMIKWNI